MCVVCVSVTEGQIANSFNHQFTTSKLGKHSSSRRTRYVSKKADVSRASGIVHQRPGVVVYPLP